MRKEDIEAAANLFGAGLYRRRCRRIVRSIIRAAELRGMRLEAIAYDLIQDCVSAKISLGGLAVQVPVLSALDWVKNDRNSKQLTQRFAARLDLVETLAYRTADA